MLKPLTLALLLAASSAQAETLATHTHWALQSGEIVR